MHADHASPLRPRSRIELELYDLANRADRVVRLEHGEIINVIVYPTITESMVDLLWEGPFLVPRTSYTVGTVVGRECLEEAWRSIDNTFKRAVLLVVREASVEVRTHSVNEGKLEHTCNRIGNSLARDPCISNSLSKVYRRVER